MGYAEEWRRNNPDKVWRSGLSCSLCDWPVAVQGGTVWDVRDALEAHWRTHPEWAEFQASLPRIEDLAGILKPTDHPPR